jgi:hypothetical protein
MSLFARKGTYDWQIKHLFVCLYNVEKIKINQLFKLLNCLFFRYEMGLSGVFEEIVNSKSEGTNQHTLKKRQQ